MLLYPSTANKHPQGGTPADKVLAAAAERAAAEFSPQASLLPQSEQPLSVPPEVK